MNTANAGVRMLLVAVVALAALAGVGLVVGVGVAVAVAAPLRTANAPALPLVDEGPVPLGDGVTYRVIAHAGVRYRVVTVDLDQAALRLVGQEPGGPHRPEDLARALGPTWFAATNAGLYHTVDAPVGLYVADGVAYAPLELGRGIGNFYLRPNGVFTVDGVGARVVDSAAYVPMGQVQLATQSGPALVLNGALHPALDPASTWLTVRNAVGVSDPHTVHLVLSEGPVRFYDLATLLRDRLGCTDALYLDGHISGMWGPSLPDGTHAHAYAGFLAAVPR